MTDDQRFYLSMAAIICLTVAACVFIMATCSLCETKLTGKPLLERGR